ncbi:MAG: helix-turn-helix transcriptional regulator [Candidatus Moranbacteria bacterium]|nr:helix-turn-helix transcriptional regulator [Candidatus Moranbacteria bacterium]
MKLSKIAQKYRDAASFTLDKMAQESGLSKGFLSRLEKGDFDSQNISLETLIKLSKGYNIKVKEILDLLNVIEQDEPAPLKVYLRKKYDIHNDADVDVIEGLINRLK